MLSKSLILKVRDFVDYRLKNNPTLGSSTESPCGAGIQVKSVSHSQGAEPQIASMDESHQTLDVLAPGHCTYSYKPSEKRLEASPTDYRHNSNQRLNPVEFSIRTWPVYLQPTLPGCWLANGNVANIFLLTKMKSGMIVAVATQCSWNLALMPLIFKDCIYTACFCPVIGELELNTIKCIWCYLDECFWLKRLKTMMKIKLTKKGIELKIFFVARCY